MNDLHKYTNPSWYEVLTEQEKNYTPVREIPVKVLRIRGESDIQYNYRVYINEHPDNPKAVKAFLRIIKYGYPKKCPIINKISNLLFI